jgi:hypothetical protein
LLSLTTVAWPMNEHECVADAKQVRRLAHDQLPRLKRLAADVDGRGWDRQFPNTQRACWSAPANRRAVIAESVTLVQSKGMVWGTPKTHQRREVPGGGTPSHA